MFDDLDPHQPDMVIHQHGREGKGGNGERKGAKENKIPCEPDQCTETVHAKFVVFKRQIVIWISCQKSFYQTQVIRGKRGREDDVHEIESNMYRNITSNATETRRVEVVTPADRQTRG
jgi:hypothetical protein